MGLVFRTSATQVATLLFQRAPGAKFVAAIQLVQRAPGGKHERQFALRVAAIADATSPQEPDAIPPPRRLREQ